MIFKKPRFKTNKTKHLWPFSVPEVAVVASTIEHQGKNINAFIIVHNFGVFSLSGIMEQHGIPSLETSGIWMDEPQIPGTKRSLTPFIEMVSETVKRVMGGEIKGEKT